MSTFDITKAFQYIFPTSSIEYIKNAKSPSVSSSLILTNTDPTTTISFTINSDNTQLPAVKVYDTASTLVSNNTKVVQLAPLQSKTFSVVANNAPEMLSQSRNIIQENLLFNVVSGSVTSSLAIVNINTASNDRFGVDIDVAPEEYYKYDGRYTSLAGEGTALGTYQSFIAGEYQYEPVFKITKSSRIIYTRGQLQEKQRKLRIILDNFSQPSAGYQSAGVSGPNLGIMKNNIWFFNRADFPNMNPKIYSDPKLRPNAIYDGESINGATVRLLKQAIANALFCETDTCGDDYPEDYRTALDFSDTYIPSTVTINGRNLSSFERVLWYCQNVTQYYIRLIDHILNTTDTAYINIDSDNIENARIQTPVTITFTTYTVPLLDALLSASSKAIVDNTSTFFDASREYKTVLNFNNDQQYLVEAWRLAPNTSIKVQLKLLSPLNDSIQVFDTAYITRDIAKSVVDTLEFELGDEADVTPYLRPANTSIKFDNATDKLIVNASLSTLGLETGSAGTIISGSTVSYGDTVFRRWFTSDFKSSELNIDFTNYENFVTFGSAYNRLVSFKNKLTQIETLTTSSISASISSSMVGPSNRAIQIESIIRNFDPYEQFLYFSSESAAYSASADYADSGVEYNFPATWPKNIDGTVYSVAQASSWFSAQSLIAQRYDEHNQNYLIKHLPLHIQENTDSGEFLTFVSMIGHMMDNIKVYIDQFPYVYSTSPDPFSELTMDQVYEVAQSFGLELPNVYSLTNLENFISTYSGESGARSLVAETWKRVLHSAVFLAKAKGSRTSLDAVLNTYGITSPALQIKESTYPVEGNYIRSDELVYGVTFASASSTYVATPLVSASLTGSTIQLRFNPTVRTSGSILSSNGWAVDIIPHPSQSKLDYGKINVVSGSSRTVIASSSYFPLYSTDYTDIMLRSQSSDLNIIQADGDQILYQESASVTFGNLWNNTQIFYIGGSGSNSIGSFNGVVDEVRVWGEDITKQNFIEQAYDPGSLYGNNYTSSYANLYVQLSFSQPLTSVTQSIVNETPYISASVVPTIPAYGFTTASFTRFQRSIKQFTPIVGGTIFSNRKVVVAPEPEFLDQFVDGNGTKVLQPNTSIKSVEDKIYTAGLNQVSVAVSPTDYINQNIIRKMGVIDVNNVIGTPRNIKSNSYGYLDTLRNEFLKYFNQVVDPNEYIRFFRNLVTAPSEMAESMIPARSKVIDGVVIESDILFRNKTTLARSIKVSGTDTKLNNAFVSGSGSFDVGAYSFDATYDMEEERVLLGDTSDIAGIVDMPEEVMVISSTPSNQLPATKRVGQYINKISSGSLVTSSLLDNKSAFMYIEANTIDTRAEEVLTSPYPRNPYRGIPSRIPSEESTVTPLYAIPPRADFSDVGTTTYFHKENGIYSYELITPYKVPYVTKLDTELDSPLDRIYANITLLTSGTLVSPPGRDNAEVMPTTYTSGSNITGVLKMANTFTLLGITGASGLRLRLYSDVALRDTDTSRPFTTLPSSSQGVLFDGLLDGQQDVFPYLMIQTTDSNIYYTVSNITASDISSGISIDYFVYESGNPAPSGYLPRHYKFSRDNTTAVKRRNYMGTRDTDSVTPPGCPWSPCPPWGVQDSEANKVVVNTDGVTVIP